MGIFKLVGAAVGAGLKGASAVVKLSNLNKLNGIFNLIPLKYTTEDGIEHHYCFTPVIEKNLGTQFTLLFLGDIDMDRVESISLALISGAEHAYLDMFKKNKEKDLTKGKIHILEEMLLQEKFEELNAFGTIILVNIVTSRSIREKLDKSFKNINYSIDTTAFLPIAEKNFVGYTFFKYEAKTLTGTKEISVPRMGISQIWKKKYIINRPDINTMITDWYNIKDKKESKKKRNEISVFVKNFIKEEMAPPT